MSEQKQNCRYHHLPLFFPLNGQNDDNQIDLPTITDTYSDMSGWEEKEN